MNWNKLVAKYDKGDYLGKILSFPEQCKEGWKLGKKFKFKKPKGIEKIFVTGMGGSGYTGQLVQQLLWSQSKVPMFVEKGYVLPPFIDKKTFYIIVSYSGNTEEPLTIYKKLQRKKVPTIGITSNGFLKRSCKNCIIVPEGYQPRQATGYHVFSMLAVLKKAGLVQISEREISQTVNLMKREQKDLVKKAQKFAKIIGKKMPMVYATEALQASAIRWQHELNEIAKVFCHWNYVPELQHNEINASLNLGKAHFFLLKTNKETKKMRIRMQYMRKRIKSIGYNFTEIEAKGNSLLANIWYANYLGSLTAFYLAMLNHLDPAAIPLITGMKAYLKKRF